MQDNKVNIATVFLLCFYLTYLNDINNEADVFIIYIFTLHAKSF